MSLCARSIPGRRSSYRKSTTILGYPVKLEKRFWSLYPADRMKAWPISARVDSPKNNDAEIIVRSSFNPCSNQRINRNCCELNLRNVAGSEQVIHFNKAPD